MVTDHLQESGPAEWNNVPMRMRMALGALVTALLVLGLLPGAPVRAAEFTYDFEGCQQGWEPKAKGSKWTHGHTEVPSSNTTDVVKNIQYNNSEARGDTLTSKPHAWGGGKGVIKLRARWLFEWYPDESLTLDRAVLEMSTDAGQTWKPRQGFRVPQPEFTDIEVPFDAPAGAFMLRFVVYSDTSVELYGIEIDDVTVPTAAPDGTACKK